VLHGGNQRQEKQKIGHWLLDAGYLTLDAGRWLLADSSF